MPKLIIRGARIRSIDLRYKDETVVARVHFAAEYTTPLQDEMNWTEIPDSITQCKLEGAVFASHMILTPHDKAMEQHERQVTINELSDFAVRRIDEDGVTRTELRFVAATPAAGAVAILEDYLRTVGEAEALLVVRYADQPELGEDIEEEHQDKLPIESPHSLAPVAQMKRRRAK